MTLTEFLLARITEDEAAAFGTKPDGYALAAVGNVTATTVGGARLRAECEAKRRIIELHRDAGRSQGDTDTGYGEIDHCCGQCGTFGEYGTPWPCRTVRALALPYADHPDYREEWNQ